MEDKPPYKFKISDFIGAFGFASYCKRNEYTCLEPNVCSEQVVGRAFLLAAYNLGISALAIYGAVQGLEKLIS